MYVYMYINFVKFQCAAVGWWREGWWREGCLFCGVVILFLFFGVLVLEFYLLFVVFVLLLFVCLWGVFCFVVVVCWFGGRCMF